MSRDNSAGTHLHNTGFCKTKLIKDILAKTLAILVTPSACKFHQLFTERYPLKNVKQVMLAKGKFSYVLLIYSTRGLNSQISRGLVLSPLTPALLHD